MSDLKNLLLVNGVELFIQLFFFPADEPNWKYWPLPCLKTLFTVTSQSLGTEDRLSNAADRMDESK